jgi:hypothetical protein
MQSTRETITVLVVTTTVIILLLGLFVVLLLYLNQKRQIGFQRKLQTLRNEYERNLLNVQLEVQEQTLHHVSREIHDNIGLSLTLAKLNLNSLQNELAVHSRSEVTESAELISKAIQDLSSISRGLNSSAIANNGLIKALEEECNRINKTGIIDVSLKVTGDAVYGDSHKELFLFRIAQEALNNVIKYANATKSTIILHYEKEELRLAIADNGRGMDLTTKPRIGSGLLNMESRAKLLNGSFHIESGNEGTCITVIIPLN